MGRRKLYPDEYDIEIESSAKDLIKRVNNLLNALGIDQVGVTSGWRPKQINAKASGAKKSLHMVGKAVDLSDKDGKLKSLIEKNSELLIDFGLWMESPDSTPTWCHLDTGIRSVRAVRIFKP
jgi:uncharacterized protein YcbK (DUF882 family)